MAKLNNKIRETEERWGAGVVEQVSLFLRLNRDYYRAGTSKMSDLLEAQLLYQQALDRRTDAYADYQNKLLEYRQATGQ